MSVGPSDLGKAATSAQVAGADGAGVFYRDQDYAGILRRLLVDLVDGVAIVVASAAVLLFCILVLPEDSEWLATASLTSLTAVWFVYFVLLKRSRGTLGYLIGGVRIVDLRGQRPGMVALAFRLLFAVIGPFNLLVDLFWIGSDGRRQALRDKFAGTYVIRKGARPAGSGEIGYSYYGILGTNFIFREVKAATPPGPTALSASQPGSQ